MKSKVEQLVRKINFINGGGEVDSDIKGVCFGCGHMRSPASVISICDALEEIGVNPLELEERINFLQNEKNGGPQFGSRFRLRKWQAKDFGQCLMGFDFLEALESLLEQKGESHASDS